MVKVEKIGGFVKLTLADRVVDIPLVQYEIDSYRKRGSFYIYGHEKNKGVGFKWTELLDSGDNTLASYEAALTYLKILE